MARMEAPLTQELGHSGQPSLVAGVSSRWPTTTQLRVMGSLRSSIPWVSARVARRCGPFLEAVTVPDGPFAGVVGHLEILSQLEAVRRAGVFTQPAKHATRSVVGKESEDFPASGLVALPPDHNEVFRARQRAEVAGDAQRLPRLRVLVQTRRAAIAFGHHGPLEGILLGINVLGVLIAERHRSEERRVGKESR